MKTTDLIKDLTRSMDNPGYSGRAAAIELLRDFSVIMAEIVVDCEKLANIDYAVNPTDYQRMRFALREKIQRFQEAK